MAKSRSWTVIIGNDKGGVGKDLVAEGLATLMQRRAMSFQIIEVESEPRLQPLYEETRYIPAPAVSAEELYEKPDVIFQRFDELAEATGERPYNIVCLGANLTGVFLQWSRNGGSGTLLERTDVVLCAVLTMNNAALETGLRNLAAFAEEYPDARRVAILNEYAADFVPGDKRFAKLLRDAKGESGRIETYKVPRMTAPAWGHIQNLGPLAKAAQMDAQALVDRGLPEGISKRSMISYRTWFENKFLPSLEKLLP